MEQLTQHFNCVIYHCNLFRLQAYIPMYCLPELNAVQNPNWTFNENPFFG